VKQNPFIAGLLSLAVPGLGQIYAGETNKGAATIFAAIVIANLNIIILPLIALANPASPVGPADARTLWAYWIPRIVHDVASFWSVVFWVWAAVDAVVVARRRRMP
jgi:TM2 domain-containing membrane protein YozV